MDAQALEHRRLAERSFGFVVDAWNSFRETATQISLETYQLGIAAWNLSLYYINRYPAVRTFALVSLTLSVVPVLFFSAWVLATLFGTVVTAVFSALVVQSGFVAVGLTIFLPIEICILSFAGFLALVHASGGAGLNTVKVVRTRLSNLVTTPPTAVQTYRPAQQNKRKPRRPSSADESGSSNGSPRPPPSRGRRQRREPIPKDWRRGSASETNEEVPVVPSVVQNVEKLPKGTVKGAPAAALEESVMDAL
ncbi:hypothetical protein HK097_003242 [Rhizophlyctis rosea]|uniref:Uncharacterized protein n=1 Tax=Rhizophlyctis rosea TaxID=64517 RepID=A0AAD5S2T5_9FUNG|nr:hypothetical protein HK097_003242 [Rhizophlyctis rosea]